MNANSDDKQNFTGLILLSGIDAPGVASALFSTLEPFSITLLDIEQLVIRSRLILTVLIDLDPAHAQAIEDDLNQLAIKLDVDIAMSFGEQPAESIQEKSGVLRITVSADKFSPGMIADFATRIFDNGGNIERVHRLASGPQSVFEFQISGISKDEIAQDLRSCENKFGVDINFLEKL
jgi:phosphoserine phosphatase